MKPLQAIKTGSYNALFLFAVLAVLAVTAWLTGKYIQAVCLIFVWVGLFYTSDKMLHFWYDAICLMVSTALLTGCLLATLPISYSLISVVPVVAFAIYILRTIRDRNDLHLENQKYKAPKPFNVKTCTEAELRERCKDRFPWHKNYGTNVDKYIERAVEHFIKRTKHIVMDSVTYGDQSKHERKTMKRYLEQQWDKNY